MGSARRRFWPPPALNTAAGPRPRWWLNSIQIDQWGAWVGARLLAPRVHETRGGRSRFSLANRDGWPNTSVKVDQSDILIIDRTDWRVCVRVGVAVQLGSSQSLKVSESPARARGLDSKRRGRMWHFSCWGRKSAVSAREARSHRLTVAAREADRRREIS